ncbi:hypothetical protein ADH66_12410 [Acutalibacter muris]|uniref:Uncharacterized protein n=1 Tax=Acutalibacter muris TaxID=1796620 RepID=A0ABM6L7U0_9FIRM|nr:hypothetical protein A4V00_15915 [Hungateiclostridiaceae bacterium KB18]ASB41386.1 hypothetical protein ADH66_12410 [Acutalibacter muris]
MSAKNSFDLLCAEHSKHPTNPYMFPSPKTGEMYHPDSIVNLHKKILKSAGLGHLKFHDDSVKIELNQKAPNIKRAPI